MRATPRRSKSSSRSSKARLWGALPPMPAHRTAPKTQTRWFLLFLWRRLAESPSRPFAAPPVGCPSLRATHPAGIAARARLAPAEWPHTHTSVQSTPVCAQRTHGARRPHHPTHQAIVLNAQSRLAVVRTLLYLLPLPQHTHGGVPLRAVRSLSTCAGIAASHFSAAFPFPHCVGTSSASLPYPPAGHALGKGARRAKPAHLHVTFHCYLRFATRCQ